MEVSSWEDATTTALLAVGGYCIHRISRPIDRPVKELQGQLLAASAVFREIQRHLPEPKTNGVENPERFAKEFLSRLLDTTSLRQAVWIRVGINAAFAKTEWSLGERLIERLRLRQRAETRILDVIHASIEFWYPHVVIHTLSSSGEELRCDTDYSTGLEHYVGSDSPRSSTITFKSEPAESLFWSATVCDFARRMPIPTPTHTAGDAITAARAAAD